MVIVFRLAIFLLVFFVGGMPSQAIYRGQQVRSSQRQVCRVLISDNSGKLISFCSGTFIDKRNFATAGHCLGSSRASNYKVECDLKQTETNATAEIENYSLTASGNLMLTDGYSAALTVTPDKVSKLSDQVEPRTDVGILHFNKDQGVQTIPVFDPRKDNKLKFKECFAVGFGMSRMLGSRMAANFLNMAKVNPVGKGDTIEIVSNTALCELSNKSSVRSTAADLAKILMKIKVPTDPLILPGDSGSPLVCVAQTGERRLMGIMSRYEIGMGHVGQSEFGVVSQQYAKHTAVRSLVGRK
jgi:hypothetical protein